MILRYTVETLHTKTFTASKKVEIIDIADKKVYQLIRSNRNLIRVNYSWFRLYLNNFIIKIWNETYSDLL